MKILTALPLLTLLFGSVAVAQSTSAPVKIDPQTVEGLQFTDQEIKIISEQIKAAQERAKKAETPKSTPSQSLKDIKLPTKAEIAEIQKQMPDLNAILGEIMRLAQEEKFQTEMQKSVDRMKTQFEAENFETKDGVPDMNAMIGAMLMLFAEDEMIDNMLTQIVPMVEAVEKHVPESKAPTQD